MLNESGLNESSLSRSRVGPKWVRLKSTPYYSSSTCLIKRILDHIRVWLVNEFELSLKRTELTDNPGWFTSLLLNKTRSLLVMFYQNFFFDKVEIEILQNVTIKSSIKIPINSTQTFLIKGKITYQAIRSKYLP